MFRWEGRKSASTASPARNCRVGWADGDRRRHGDRWADLVDVFERRGPRGAWPRTSACYCMFWRLAPTTRPAFAGVRREPQRGTEQDGDEADLSSTVGCPGSSPIATGVRSAAFGLAAVRAPSVWSTRRKLRPEDAGDDERTWSCRLPSMSRRTRLADGRRHGASRGGGGTRGRARCEESRGLPRPGRRAWIRNTGYDTMFDRAGFRLIRPGRGRGRALWQKDVRPSKRTRVAARVRRRRRRVAVAEVDVDGLAAAATAAANASSGASRRRRYRNGAGWSRSLTRTAPSAASRSSTPSHDGCSRSNARRSDGSSEPSSSSIAPSSRGALDRDAHRSEAVAEGARRGRRRRRGSEAGRRGASGANSNPSGTCSAQRRN